MLYTHTHTYMSNVYIYVGRNIPAVGIMVNVLGGSFCQFRRARGSKFQSFRTGNIGIRPCTAAPYELFGGFTE